MSEWKEYKLGDYINVINGFAFKSINFLNEKSEDSLPIIKIKNVANGDANLEAVQYHKYDESLSNFVVKKANILLALTGNHPQAMTQVVGDVSRYKLDEKALLNQRVANIKAKEGLDIDYLYYFLKDDATHNYLANQSSGSANQANISKSDIEKIPIQLPELPEQTAIAEVLSSLDDKIDLLHRQNKTMEQLAETLFRQWFVEEAEESWEKGNLSDLVIVKYGKDHKKLNDGSIPAYGSGGLMRHVDTALYQKESVLVPRKGTLSNVMYTDEPFWTVDTMFYTEMKKPNIAKFVYHFLNIQDLASMNVGSAVPSMTTQVLNNLPLAIPPDSSFEKFESITAEHYKKLKSNTTQIRTLTQLRDTLLPKLMSGEVRVSYDSPDWGDGYDSAKNKSNKSTKSNKSNKS